LESTRTESCDKKDSGVGFQPKEEGENRKNHGRLANWITGNVPPWGGAGSRKVLVKTRFA